MGVYRLLPTTTTLQTDDGDTSFEAFAQGVARDFPMQDPAPIVPADEAIIKLALTWVAKDPTASGDILKVGVLSGALRQYGDEQTLDAAGYFTFTDEFAVDSSDGLGWSIAKLQSAQLTALATTATGSQNPRITQLVCDVHTFKFSELALGVASLSPNGTPSSLSPTSGGETLNPIKADP